MSTAHALTLNKIYGLQRHIYDVTRKYYLFGRDSVLHRIAPRKGQHVIEVGTGTARNLIKMARRYPEARYYGIDASDEMLKTAKQKVEKANISDKISLQFGFAEQADSWLQFDQRQGFDHILFSYSLSMIPEKEKALETAYQFLVPGGSLWVVDFWDQHSYPALFRSLLTRWLALFHVHPDSNFQHHALEFSKMHDASVEFFPVGGSYALITRIRRP